MSKPFYFFYQEVEKVSAWELAEEATRLAVTASRLPQFQTVLSLDLVPSDGDFSAVRYLGPMYFDFDADGDLPLACEKFKEFLGKLQTSWRLELNQVRLFASGGKGFHVEIPMECFIPKPEARGYPNLAYVYDRMARSIVVDTMDLRVYTGRKGRMWRTVNVRRASGTYKVPLTLAEALAITLEGYATLVQAPRPTPHQAPPTLSAPMSMAFSAAVVDVQKKVRDRKARKRKSNALLAKFGGKTPPTVTKIMAGEGIGPEVGFQKIAMQLAIYASEVSMPRSEFLTECEGLVSNHVGDGSRYRDPDKRRAELARMWDYMDGNVLYDFDAGGICSLLPKGTQAPDLGHYPAKEHMDEADGQGGVPDDDDGSAPSATMARGVKMEAGTIVGYDKEGGRSALGRFVFDSVETMFAAEDTGELHGLGVTLTAMPDNPFARPRKISTVLNGSEFASASSFRTWAMRHGLAWQGTDTQTTGVADTLLRMGRTTAAGAPRTSFSYPREGLTVMLNPNGAEHGLAVAYVTERSCKTSTDDLPDRHPAKFTLRHLPAMAAVTYKADLMDAPPLSNEHRKVLRAMMGFSAPHSIAMLVGWMASCHHRAWFQHVFQQFSILQVFGEAGSGKTKSMEVLGRLHWLDRSSISLPSVLGITPYAFDALVNGSSSLPAMLDEFKPRELQKKRGTYEKAKDILKAGFVGGPAGARGTLNKGATTSISVVKSKVTAPLAILAEAMESETAIIERSVMVALSQGLHTPERMEAFEMVSEDTTDALPALGRALVEMAFHVDEVSLRETVKGFLSTIRERAPKLATGVSALPARRAFGLAQVAYGWEIIANVFAEMGWSDLEGGAIRLQQVALTPLESDLKSSANNKSELSKTLDRLAQMSGPDAHESYALLWNRDYLIGQGDTPWVEIRVESVYDKYRIYCAVLRDTPLFDNVDAFYFALLNSASYETRPPHGPRLSDDSTGQRIVRLNETRMREQGLRRFRLA